MVPDVEVQSYYDKPILKQPVWKWFIPAYFFTGGLAAGSAMLAAGARLRGDRRLARQSRIVALGALGVSTAFLIKDLGRPGRFSHMLRILKPTSPMSVGSWVLGAFGTAAAAGLASDLLDVLPGIGALADTAAGVIAPVMATYTAVLLADTAVPAWHEARHELPFVFAASAAASAGGIAVALTPPSEAGPARRVLAAGAVTELAAVEALHRRLGTELGETYEKGVAGKLGNWSRALTGLGAVTAVTAGGRVRPLAVVGGLATAAGGALLRFAVFEAGKASARDPKYVVGPQRRELGA
ncbi:MAG TPA: NrfD/PsrC family molybdoenzyme membrane anchor subunit [Actinomycetota bacterium]|nr:NrfD/PsrC family molybdoenzyme membrane anchor subunit [Actinomycetota bacterium]